MALTQLQVRNAKAGSHSDGNGLLLRVSASGAKSWILRVQVDGKRKDIGLGSLDHVSLAEARERARIERKAARDGIDLKVEAKKLKIASMTFKEAAESYLDHALSSLSNVKHQKQWRSTLKTYAYPTLGELVVGKVDAPDIAEALKPIWKTKSETARRVRQRIATILDHAQAKGWRDREAPERALSTLLKPIKQKAKGNFPAMPYKQVPAFVAAMRAAKTTVGRDALLFAILTAARSQEVRGARRGEFDLEAGVWIVAAERMKKRRLHRVPLSSAAKAIVEAAFKRIGSTDDALLFPGMKGKVMSDMTLGKVLKANGGEGFTVHGFRSSFRDWAAEEGYSRDWAESALAHVVKDQTEAAYRRTDFLEQRKAMMEAWATACEK
ncbi:tyrosine-type recombinase/integrase [Novosphingobium terrae]|uniref:tyrosine-type recombinase/integrase n=1 Tax=Novosphingobium terrae TaxID=2726189 RepID=UPI00197F63EE|nr:site-specific integrase [Novosphingobium terrae]